LQPSDWKSMSTVRLGAGEREETEMAISKSYSNVFEALEDDPAG